jgi:anti-sigma B factor antagonist
MDIRMTSYEMYELLTVSGRVDSLTAPRLGEALKEVFQAEKYQVILDLNQVNYVSSAGLRVLIDAQKICKPHNGQVILIGVPQRILETLELAGLTALFRIEANLTGLTAS